LVKNKYAKRKDGNQKEIEQQLTDLSFAWKDVSRMPEMGCDLLIFMGYVTFYCEIKDPERLTKKQRGDLRHALTKNEKSVMEFHQKIGSPYMIVTDVWGMLEAMKQFLFRAKLELLFNQVALVEKRLKDALEILPENESEG
jgi:hypothetical protein